MQREQTNTGPPDALIVENDLFFSVRLRSALERLGYRVRVAGSAAEASEAITQQTPHLAVISFGRASVAMSFTVSGLRMRARPSLPPPNNIRANFM